MPTKSEKARELRYKRPALASMGWDSIITELDDIREECYNVQYYIDTDEDTLLNVLDDDEDDLYEFKMAFTDLSTKADMLYAAISENGYYLRDDFDDCTVALIGNRYKLVGYDSDQEDYFSLCSYEQDLSVTETGKRLMRKTKSEMISTIGQCMGITLAFYDLRQSYDYLKATMDILKGENTSILNAVKEIEKIYNEANEEGFKDYFCDATNKFDRLVNSLPDRMWIE